LPPPQNFGLAASLDMTSDLPELGPFQFATVRAISANSNTIPNYPTFYYEVPSTQRWKSRPYACMPCLLTRLFGPQVLALVVFVFLRGYLIIFCKLLQSLSLRMFLFLKD